HVSGWMVLTKALEHPSASTGRSGLLQRTGNQLLKRKKLREAGMRDVSERTNGRVALFSIMSLSLCIVASVLQLRHLKGYFHKKKLI
ncbi:hypothetical protein B296_00036666, partial [Ensete ventricosum]